MKPRRSILDRRVRFWTNPEWPGDSVTRLHGVISGPRSRIVRAVKMPLSVAEIVRIDPDRNLAPGACGGIVDRNRSVDHVLIELLSLAQRAVESGLCRFDGLPRNSTFPRVPFRQKPDGVPHVIPDGNPRAGQVFPRKDAGKIK